MSELNTRTTEWLVWGIMGAVILFIVVAFVHEEVHQRRRAALPDYGQLSPFSLTNQSGKVVSLDSLKGQVWLCDVIFTRCPGPCSEMTRQMKTIQDGLPKGAVKLVSITTDPVFDTPEILDRYGSKAQADPSRWYFLTGPKPDVHHAITNNLRLVMIEKPELERQSPTDFFIHSTQFVLVDQQGTIRQVYEGTQPETPAKILTDIQTLLSSK